MFVRERYVYLIAYVAEKGAYGRAICPLNKEIKKAEDIIQTEKLIAEESEMSRVSIMSYQLICKERVEDE